MFWRLQCARLLCFAFWQKLALSRVIYNLFMGWCFIFLNLKQQCVFEIQFNICSSLTLLFFKRVYCLNLEHLMKAHTLCSRQVRMACLEYVAIYFDIFLWQRLNVSSILCCDAPCTVCSWMFIQCLCIINCCQPAFSYWRFLHVRRPRRSLLERLLHFATISQDAGELLVICHVLIIVRRFPRRSATQVLSNVSFVSTCAAPQLFTPPYPDAASIRCSDRIIAL